MMRDFMSRMDKRLRDAGLLLLTCIALSAASGAVQADARVHVVVIEAMRYVPDVIEVNAGDTVVWKNKDAFPHTATAGDRDFDSGSIGSEHAWKFKARRKGVFPYVCTLHPTMKATLVVK